MAANESCAGKIFSAGHIGRINSAMSLDSLDKTCKAGRGLHGCHFGCRRALEQHSPVVNLERSVGPWRSWERASMASRRSWVRTPSAPPFEETKELTLENR